MSTIELTAVGGYSEIGKNMTAVKVGNDVIILDMGIDLEKYIAVQGEREGLEKVSPQEMIERRAIPDDASIADWKDKVRAIVCTHAHLDHIAAIPFLAAKYKCPIIGTPYTIEIIKRISSDNRLKIVNKCKRVNVNNFFSVSDETRIMLLNSQHSIVQTAIVAIFHKDSKVVYANEYKFDSLPVLGSKITESALKKVGPVDLLISDCIYAGERIKMPSESIVRDMLKDLFAMDFGGHALFITTFASHLARLKSIMQFGKQTGREIVILGRSFAKYVETAEKLNILNVRKEAQLIPYGTQVRKILKKIEQNRGKYLVVLTGHQGEPQGLLSRIAEGAFPFRFRRNDFVVFCSKTIPTQTNIAARKILENKLERSGVTMIKDIHVSGHGAREDMRRMIELLKPKYLVPCHAARDRQKQFAEIALQNGYEQKQIHLLKNGQRISLRVE